MAVTLAQRDFIDADYDASADVLYLTLGLAAAGYGDTTDEGITLRYAEADDSPIGATVIGYRSAGFPGRREATAARIADHLGVSKGEVLEALRKVGL